MINQEKIKRAKFLAIILVVSTVGVWLFVIGFSYLYNEPLDLGACGLCYKLNPGVAHCENYTPINIEDLKINFTGVDFYPPLILNESKT